MPELTNADTVNNTTNNSSNANSGLQMPPSASQPAINQNSLAPAALNQPPKNNFLLFLFFGLFLLSAAAAGFLYYQNNQNKLMISQNSPVPTASANNQANSKVLKIGGILPLTTDSASFGIPIQQAAILAQKEINEAGGINGRQIEIIWKDGRCEVNDAKAAAESLINEENVEFLIGGACSSEFLTSAPIAQQKKVITFSSSATSPKISQLGKYIFRTCPSDALAGKAAAQYAFNKWKARKAGIITENKDYTLALREVFKENFTNLGGEVIVDEVFETGTTNFAVFAEKAVSANLDVVYILPQSPTPGVMLVKALKDKGLKAKILTAEVLLIRDAIAEQGDILEGVTGIEVLFDENRPKAQKLVELYKKQYGTDPVYPSFMAGMYDIFYLLKEAYEKGASNSDEVADYLYSLKNWEGAVGSLTFDKNGDPIMTYSIRLISGGQAPQVDTYSPSE